MLANSLHLSLTALQLHNNYLQNTTIILILPLSLPVLVTLCFTFITVVFCCIFFCDSVSRGIHIRFFMHNTIWSIDFIFYLQLNFYECIKVHATNGHLCVHIYICFTFVGMYGSCCCRENCVLFLFSLPSLSLYLSPLRTQFKFLLICVSQVACNVAVQ